MSLKARVARASLSLIRSVPLVPEDDRKRFERRLRGRLELERLSSADAVCVSYGKSGRTWLRVMLAGYYQRQCGIEIDPYMGWLDIRKRSSSVPLLRFSHDNYLTDADQAARAKAAFHGKKVILLARHPGDTCVSYFFHWKYRMKGNKRWINDYPTDPQSVSLFDFVMEPRWGIPRIVDFLNGWAANRRHIERLMLVRYEDLRASPEPTLARLIEFLGGTASAEHVREAVAFASFENLQRIEAEAAGRSGSDDRLKPADVENRESYKVRRGKVGGYRDYFDDRQVAEIDRLIEDSLDPFFGYSRRGESQFRQAKSSG